MNFSSRNKPIFIVGLLAAIAFIVIIVISQQSTPEIGLIESFFETEDREVVFDPETETTESSTYIPPEEVIKEGETQNTEPLGTLIITFDGTNFSPSSANAVQGQAVRWINATNQEATIKELIEKHQEFSGGVTIPAGQSYELVLYGTKLWTFEEVGSGAIGRLYIVQNN